MVSEPSLIDTADSESECLWCGGASAHRLFSATGFDCVAEEFTLLKCDACGLARTEPFLTGTSLTRYYPVRYYGNSTAKFFWAIETVVIWLNTFRVQSVKRLLCEREQPRLLDVGSGRGSFLKAMTKLGVDCFGVERKEFPAIRDLPFELYRGEFCELDLPPASFDAVTFWHVLEHLENPRDALDEAVRIIKPGGLIVVAVPNFDSLQAKWFGRDWFHLDLPRHLHHFSTKMLCDYFVEKAFTVEVSTLATVEQSVYGFIQSAQNRLLSKVAPNRLYGLLQKIGCLRDLIVLLPLLMLAVLMLPFACVEHLVSAWCGRNAAIVLLVRKAE